MPFYISSTALIKGVAVLDFGLAALPIDTAFVIVLAPQINLTSIVNLSLRIEATAAHNADEMQINPVKLDATNLIAGVGFTIRGIMVNGKTYGTYNVNWFLT